MTRNSDVSRPERSTTCQELIALLGQCDSDDPDPRVLAELEAHIESCDVCNRAEELIVRSAASLRTYGEDQIGLEFEQRLIDQLCRKRPGET